MNIGSIIASLQFVLSEDNRTPIILRDMKFYQPLPRIVCKDGFSISVQAGVNNRSKLDANFGLWVEVELGYPSEVEDVLLPYAEEMWNPTGTVYNYVPVVIVAAIILKHGGRQINKI